MSQTTIHSQCFDTSLLVNPEQHETFILENTCLFCNKLACDICQCQLGCGALFGYGCFSNPDIDSCPKCKKTITMEKSQYKNRYINKLVSQQVKLKCPNHKNGCKEELPYDSEAVKKHEASCSYYTVYCAKKSIGCAWSGPKAYLQDHIRGCDYFEYVCVSCQSQGELQYQFLKKDQSNHEANCINQLTTKTLEQLEGNLDESKLNQQIHKLIKKQQEIIQNGNQQVSQIINYAISLENTSEKQRDKKVLLSDFKNGIVNFNCLENLQTTLSQIDNSFVKGVKLNDTNLSCYEYSFYSKVDVSETIRKIEQFAQNGEKNSQYSLARLYYWGDKTIAQDIKKAEEWVYKAVQQNSPEAYWLLGDLHYENRGKIGQDFKKAFKYYEVASSLGNAEATNSLGQMYDDGEGQPSNEKSALECFKKSAELGDYGGLYNLAVYNQEGYGGLPKSNEKAFEYYLLSAKKGDVDAMKRVALLLKQGKGAEKNLSESNKWVKKALQCKNKYNSEIASQSTMGSLNSLNSIQQYSDNNIKSDVI